MAGKVCYLNGKYIQESEAKIHISDWGLVEGGIYEIARTFNHVPFKLKEHIDRLFRSLRCLPFIKFNLTQEEIYDITLEVLKRNEASISPEDDWAIVYRVTRGIQLAPSLGATFYVQTVRLPLGKTYEQIAKWYTQGAHMVVASTRQIPPQSLNPKIKHTNRLCNHLAEFEAKMVDPEAFGLMLDIHGFAAECPRENFFMVKDDKLLTPRSTNCLEGITRETILELAKGLGIECHERDIAVADLYNADEMIITNTSLCIVPVSKFNNQVLGKPIPGGITKQLMSAFGNLVHYDLVERVMSLARTHVMATG